MYNPSAIANIFYDNGLLCLTWDHRHLVTPLKLAYPGLPIIWNNESKRYETKYSDHKFRLLTLAAQSHFKTIEYCSYLTSLLCQLDEYKYTICWTPTLVNINGRFLIAATNSELDNAIKHIPLNDDLKTLWELSTYGIITHPDIIEVDLLKRSFVATQVFEMNLKNMDITDLHEICTALKQCERTSVYFTGRFQDFYMIKKHNTIAEFKAILKVFGIVSTPNYYYHDGKLIDSSAHQSTDVLFVAGEKMEEAFDNQQYDSTKFSKIIYLTGLGKIWQTKDAT